MQGRENSAGSTRGKPENPGWLTPARERALQIGALAALLVWAALAGPYFRLEADTRAKLEGAERIEAELNARRAARYAAVIAACLGGGDITDGARVVACEERR